MRWRRDREPTKSESGFTAGLSLALSVAALLVSLFSAVYSLVDERYDLRMVSSFTVPEVIGSNPPLIKSQHTLTFINNGNRPVAINEVALIVQPTTKSYEQLNRMNCEADLAGPNMFRRAYAKITPFTVKAGEIETRVFSFADTIGDADTARFKDRESPNHLLSCIQVDFVSGQGSFGELIPHAWSPRASGFGEMFTEVKFFHPHPVYLVRSRWPFKPTPVASE